MHKHKYSFDYIVIGSGPAGSTAAISLAKAKKRVAVVEGHLFGGSELNTRDIPYHVALESSKLYYEVNHSPVFKNQDLSFSLPNSITYQQQASTAAGGNSTKSLEDAGVICLNGYANFLDSHTISLGDQQFTSSRFIIASGSHLKVAGISGTETVNFLTPDTALKIRRKPKAVLIVGGGSTGCEIAEYFADLGTKVLLMETASRILPREDPEVSEIISTHLASLGTMVLPNCKVVSIEQDAISKRAIFRNARTEKMVRIDCIVLATGSEPNIDLGLENAGVKYQNSGIIVDRYFTTSAKNIFAIGDVLGRESSTALAIYEGSVLASNLLNRTKNQINYQGFARITKTHPTVATIGLNEDDLLRRDRKYQKAIVKLDDLTIGKIPAATPGFVKLLADRSKHIIGATIIAATAEHLTAEISLAIRHNLTAVEIASTPHVINSPAYAIKLAAKQLVTKQKSA